MAPDSWEEDRDAQNVFEAIKTIAEGVDVVKIYAIRDDPAATILDHAALFGVDFLILGHFKRSAVKRLLQGSVIQQVGTIFPGKPAWLLPADRLKQPGLET